MFPFEGDLFPPCPDSPDRPRRATVLLWVKSFPKMERMSTEEEQNRLAPPGQSLKDVLREEEARASAEVGEWLRIERTRLKLSQEDIGKTLGLDKKTAGRLERGERPLLMSHVRQLHRVYGIDPQGFVEAVARVLGADEASK